MELTFFNENGYQIFDNIIPEAILDNIREVLEIDATKSLCEIKAALNYSEEKNIFEYIDKIKNENLFSTLTPEVKKLISGHISLEARLNPILRDIPLYPAVNNILKMALGSDQINLHMPPTARFIMPKNLYAAVPPHQDVSYNKHMSNFITMWVPLVDIDDECGGVIVYKGSSNLQELPVIKNENEVWFNEIPVQGYEPFHCKMKKGGLLLMNSQIVHRSADNLSLNTRYSIDFRLFSSNDVSTKHYLNLQDGRIIDLNRSVNENV
jgi:hypothetical protein